MIENKTVFYLVFVGFMFFTLITGCGRKNSSEVIVYVSEDQVFSEPILSAFEAESGIRIRAVYDTEETKSTGVMNRLIAGKNNPQADVYWANEPIRAIVLARSIFPLVSTEKALTDVKRIHSLMK